LIKKTKEDIVTGVENQCANIVNVTIVGFYIIALKKAIIVRVVNNMF